MHQADTTWTARQDERLDAEVLVPAILKHLTYRQKNVLMMRYGVNGGRPMTLEAIGRHFKVSRERVRMLIREGLERGRVIVATKAHEVSMARCRNCPHRLKEEA